MFSHALTDICVSFFRQFYLVMTQKEVTYPPGVREISDELSTEELVRRLKVTRYFLNICICFIAMHRIVARTFHPNI